jgi:multidrug resistance efflux pump
MKEKEPEILYSEPVREIMGNPPGKILRYGTGVILCVFIVFILFACLIRYPDTIPAPVVITTSNPPVTLVTKVTGNIKNLFVREKERVKAGQLLAVMETAASIDEVRSVKQIMDTLRYPEKLINSTLPDLFRLGELQEGYAAFIRNLADLRNFIDIDYYGHKIISLNSEINGIQSYIDQLRIKEKYFVENQKIESRRFHRDSLLFADKVIPESEFETSHQSLIKLNIELQQVRLELSGKIIEMAEKNQLLEDYIIKKVEERQRLQSVLNESYTGFEARIHLWETNYLLVAPVDGTISFTKYWTVNQTVMKDEPVMTIVPADQGDILGRVNLSMIRSGKVKIGQLVNIKFSGFPYLEYGMVRGIVRSKSLVPSGDAYIIEISLPSGLETLYGTKLEFNQNMQGTAEIITEDIRLIQKIFNPLRYMISKNRR